MTPSAAPDSGTTLSGPLLEFLKGELGACRYAEPPTALVRGNETDVYSLRLDGLAPPLDRPLVLRLFRPGTEPDHVRTEAVVQNAVADQGFPAPRAFTTCTTVEILGAPFFVMERVPGATYLGDTLGLDRSGTPQMAPWGVVRQGLRMLTEMPRKLAEVEVRMHALEVSGVAAALEEVHVPWQTRTVEGVLQRVSERSEKSAADGLRAGIEWLRRHLPSSSDPLVICHGDMQPLNLMIHDRQVSGVLDWSNTAFAPAECQVGWTRSVFLTLVLPLPAILRPAERLIANTIADRYRSSYQLLRSSALDEDAVRYYEAFRCMEILVSMADRAAQGKPKRDAWDSPRAFGKLEAHFTAISGTSVSLEARSPDLA